jgi:hypothetical protein
VGPMPFALRGGFDAHARRSSRRVGDIRYHRNPAGARNVTFTIRGGRLVSVSRAGLVTCSPPAAP